MKKHLKYTLVIIGFIALSVSCSKTNSQDDICDPNQICYTSKPTELYVKLELSSSPNAQPIQVSFYEGYFDDGELFDTFTTNSSEEYYLMPVGKRYTATAKYVKNGDTIMVIDSEKLNAASYENCEETCYDYDAEIVLDLKLD
ncbi:hypothetical protein [Brumimicrobium mesophilum]|uniref:hypothetical protein n=1 Tax=Brumimicrobium mesophilum TaxID=392717 RepID=UPI000D142670|nr:hypothetical protein [Brumimicrobium mesophilum]